MPIRTGTGGSSGSGGTTSMVGTGGAGGQGKDASMTVPADAPSAGEEVAQETRQPGSGGSLGSGGVIGAGGTSSGVAGSGGTVDSGGGSGGDRSDAPIDPAHDAMAHDAMVDANLGSDAADAKTGAEANPALCPATFGASEGQACPITQGTCDYAEGRCGCLACMPDGGMGGETSSYWHCRAWTDVPAGCPAQSPTTGTACSADGGLACDYSQCCGGPSLGPSMQCLAGTWQPDLLLAGGCACAIRRCP